MTTPSLSRSALSIRNSVFADLAPRIEAHLARGGTLVPLHIGDTHVAPPRTSRFLHGEDVDDGALYRYGPIPGDPLLLDACVARLVAHGRAPAGLGRANVLVTSGATHGLYCASRALLEPGDEVIVPSPYWPLSVGVFRACSAEPVEAPLTQELYARPERDAGELLARHLTARTRAIYLITPNNPDGKVLSAAQLRSIGALAREKGLWILSDEVYADYAYEGEHVSMAALPGMAERTVSVYSFSKSHALAGARVGFVVAPPEVIALARRISTHTVFNVPVVSQRACARALQEGEAWVDAAREEYRAARDAAAAALAGAPVTFALPDGGSYLFLDFREVLAGRPLLPLLARALEHGVLLAPGDAFGAGFESFARLCFTAVPRAALLDGVTRLRAALDSYVSSGGSMV